MRTLVENETYTQSVNRLGGARRLDNLLELLTCSIAEKAEVFPKVPGFKGLRIAKTDKVSWKPSIKRLKLFFRILDENRVELLWISEFGDEAE